MAEVATKGAATPPAAESSGDTLARLGAQRRKWKDAAKKLTDERDAQKAEIAKLTKDIEDLKKSGPEEIAALKAKLKEQAHRGKFDELAKAAGVKEKALNDLWEKSGYKPEADAPDEAAIKTAIEKQRTERDYLFEAAAQEGQAVEQPQIVPGPGRGQGGTAANNAGRFQATQAQLRDPAWCNANGVELRKMAKDVANLPTARVTDKFAIV